MPVVIKDVAKKAKVAPSTVSKYLNASEKISNPKLAERIQSAIDELGYVPNQMARSMRTGGQTNLIAVIVPDILNPFYSEIFNHIRDACDEYNYTPLLYTTEDHPDVLQASLNKINTRQVDGIIICFLDDSEVIDVFSSKQQNIPIALMSAFEHQDAFNTVIIDFTSCFYEITTYLIKSARKKIAFVGSSYPDTVSSKKLNGYLVALEANDIPVSDDYIVMGSNYSYATGYKLTEKLMHLPEPPDAIVAGNDTLAIGCMKYLILNDYKIPKGVAVTGFDGIQLGAIFEPTLTTYAVPLKDIAATATDMVIQRINDPKAPFRQSNFFGKLVERRSTNKNAIVDSDFV
jgi:DNA-binding LacI/PurR family transcriptional regulator